MQIFFLSYGWYLLIWFPVLNSLPNIFGVHQYDSDPFGFSFTQTCTHTITAAIHCHTNKDESPHKDIYTNSWQNQMEQQISIVLPTSCSISALTMIKLHLHILHICLSEPLPVQLAESTRKQVWCFKTPPICKYKKCASLSTQHNLESPLPGGRVAFWETGLGYVECFPAAASEEVKLIRLVIGRLRDCEHECAQDWIMCCTA